MSTRTTVSSATILAAATALAGCSDTMKLESKMEGELTTVLKLEGPVQIQMEPLKLELQMQMQGPSVQYQGTYISEELLDKVKVGTTTEDWIMAVFGEPDAKSPLRDGTEIWKWAYYPTEQQSALVEVFGGGGDKKPKLGTRSVFLQMREGRVIEKWKG